MKIAYFDCFSGASGDMILSSLLDAGLPLKALASGIEMLGLDHYEIKAEKTVKKGISGTRALISIDQTHHEHHHRGLPRIKQIIEGSKLGKEVKAKSIKIFERLARAEAKVHNMDISKVHFHEIGAMDALIDVVGAVIGLETLGIEKICCSAIHVGSGHVECAHGILPVPAPATTELVKGWAIYSNGLKAELLTPTGAAILTTLASENGSMPLMSLEASGYGAGTRETTGTPNLLRVLIGQSVGHSRHAHHGHTHGHDENVHAHEHKHGAHLHNAL